MPSPTTLTLFRLRECGFTCATVGKWVPKINRRRDLFGFADVLAVHPTRKEILLIQATTAGHVAHRLEKSRRRLGLRIWLAAGGLFAVWGWHRRSGRWDVKIVNVQGEDLADVIVTAPPRRGRRARQPDLFDAVSLEAAGGPT